MLFLNNSPGVLPGHEITKCVGLFLAAGGRKDQVFRCDATLETPVIVTDELGQTHDVPSLAGGTEIDAPDLARVLRVFVLEGHERMLIAPVLERQQLMGKAMLDLTIRMDVLWSGAECVKNRSGRTGSVGQFCLDENRIPELLAAREWLTGIINQARAAFAR